MATVNEKMTAIADAIRDKTGETNPLNLDDMAVGVGKVYDAGKSVGLDDFWDLYQNKGRRAYYRYAFAGEGWTNDTFKPRYDITPTNTCYGMFWDCGVKGDLVEILNDLGITLDLSKATSYHYLFDGADFTRLGVINLTGTTTLSYAFQGMGSLVTIDKLIIKSDGSNTFSSTFKSLPSLENILIEGVIGQNGCSFQQSTKLSGTSIVSIIEALSTTKTGLTVTLSKTAVNAMTYPITSAQTGTVYNSWNELIGTRSTWTVSLA